MADCAYLPWNAPKPGFFVYRAWGKADKSLYVGMVGLKGPASLARRLGQHMNHAAWWPEVIRIDWTELRSVQEACDEEEGQIATLAPAHNQRRGIRPPAPRPPSPEEQFLLGVDDPELRAIYARRFENSRYGYSREGT